MSNKLTGKETFVKIAKVTFVLAAIAGIVFFQMPNQVKAKVNNAIPSIYSSQTDLNANLKCAGDKTKGVKKAAGKCGEGKCGGDKGKAVKTDMFKAIDTNSDGKVTKEEFAAHAAEEYAAKDKNNDGKVDSKECMMFDKFNKDGNDYLSKDEFVKGHKGMFDKIDSDKSGSISRSELNAFHKSMMEPGKFGGGKKIKDNAVKKAEGKKAAKKDAKCGSDK